MIPTNLDVTQLFPYPGELSSPPLRAVSQLSNHESQSTEVAGKPANKAPDETTVEVLTENLHKLNAGLMNFGIEFEISDVDNRLITRVVDRETGDLIRQIPSEEALRIARSMDKTSGLLLQTTA
jgi:flagellar protein FlaG